MPTPAIALKVKKFRRRFGIAAPRVTIRPHLGRRWTVAALSGGAAVIAIIVWSIAQYGETAALKGELAALKERMNTTQAELSEYSQSRGTEQNVVEIERTAQRQLADRIRILERENSGLKEEIALFERLVPPMPGEEALVRVERVRVTKDGEGGLYRYRVLLRFQGGKQMREFRGRLQVRVTFSLAGKDQALTLPDKSEQAADYQIEIKQFMRKEGSFTLPSGARLKSVEASVFQGDTLKARANAQL